MHQSAGFLAKMSPRAKAVTSQPADRNSGVAATSAGSPLASPRSPPLPKSVDGVTPPPLPARVPKPGASKPAVAALDNSAGSVSPRGALSPPAERGSNAASPRSSTKTVAMERGSGAADRGSGVVPGRPKGALALLKSLKSNSKLAAEPTVGVRDVSFAVSLAGTHVVRDGKSKQPIVQFELRVEHKGRRREVFLTSLQQTVALRQALKRKQRAQHLPPVKASADLVPFFQDVFQLELRSSPVVADFLEQRASPSDGHPPSEKAVLAFAMEVLGRCGVAPGTPLAAQVLRRAEVDAALRHSSSAAVGASSSSSSGAKSPRGGVGGAPNWQRVVMERITNGVLEERQRAKDDALQLIDRVMTDSRCLTVRARTRLREQPKFQELLASFSRDTGAADELESSAKATGTLIKVLSQYIREAQENDKLEAAEAGAEVAPVPLDLRLVSDDLEYVDVGSADEPHLRCAFCQLVSVEPLVAECGHLFCMACLELHANQKTCPLDGSAFRETLRQPPADLIAWSDALVVRCLAMVHGCFWSGPRSTALVHNQTECEFPLVACTNCQSKVVVAFHDEQDCEAAFVARFQRQLEAKQAASASLADEDGSMSYSTNSRAGAEPDDNLSGDISFSSDENDVASGGGGGAQSGSDAFANTLRCGNCESAVDPRNQFCDECGSRVDLWK